MISRKTEKRPRESGAKNVLNKHFKEFRCLYDIASITGDPEISLHDRLTKIVDMLTGAFHYPEFTSARITLNGEEFKTENYGNTRHKISADIIVQGTRAGAVEIGYIKTPPKAAKDLFSKEERLMLDAVAERLGAITEHRQAEEALKESEEKFSKAFNASPNAMVITSQKDGRFIEVNESHIRVTGYTREETIGRTTTELNAWVNPKDRHRIVKILEKKGHVDNEEIQFRTKSGKTYTALFSAEKINIGGEPCLISVSADITEQKQSQEILQMVSHDSPLGIYILQDDKIKYTNPQFQKITGYRQIELLDRELLSLVAIEDSDVVRSSTAFTLQESSPYPCEYRILNKNGQVKWVMQTVSLIRYDGRDAILGNLMDITERKYLERKVIEYEELSKMKSDLLATVSHELRTPLATIKGYSTMILDYYSRLSSDETKDYLISIDNSTDRLTKLVDNLLDTSRMEAGLLKLEKSPTNIHQLLKRVAAEASIRANHHKIITELSNNLPRLNIDVKRIRQVLDNLIDNAIKYSPQETEVLISAKKSSRELLITIKDQGTGIPAEELTSIFDRMYRIEQRLTSGVEGMGLGLYICQGLVEAHGGRIWAESTVGQGSAIHFTLPIVSAEKGK